MFLTIEIPTTIQSNSLLTTQLMHWQEGVWIWDLRPTLVYWQSLAKRQQLSLHELFKTLLDQEFGKSYSAVLAIHPWPSLLLQRYMSLQKLDGLLDAHDRFGSHLFRDISWQAWEQAIRTLAVHAEARKLKGFTRRTFNKQLERLLITAQRLGAPSPWVLQTVGTQAIRRRFGSFMEQVWQWTFPQTHTQLHHLIDDFPWQRWEQPCTYKVARHLDDPALDWTSLQDFLRQDFTRICEQVLGKDVTANTEPLLKFVSLKWRLNLMPSCTPLDVHIRFRHPHALQRELHVHGTALLQAQYAFTQAVHDLYQQQAGTALHTSARSLSESPKFSTDHEMFWVVGWELSVEELLRSSHCTVDLFGEFSCEDQRLLELENRLAIPLEHYDVRNDWSVEESFATYGSDGLPTQSDDSNSCLPSLCALARKRPLFVYRKMQPLSRPPQSSGLWEFCERTMTRWWQRPANDKPALGLAQDYYRYIDAQQRNLWVSRHDSKEWYVHGIFA